MIAKRSLQRRRGSRSSSAAASEQRFDLRRGVEVDRPALLLAQAAPLAGGGVLAHVLVVEGDREDRLHDVDRLVDRGGSQRPQHLPVLVSQRLAALGRAAARLGFADLEVAVFVDRPGVDRRSVFDHTRKQGGIQFGAG